MMVMKREDLVECHHFEEFFFKTETKKWWMTL